MTEHKEEQPDGTMVDTRSAADGLEVVGTVGRHWSLLNNGFDLNNFALRPAYGTELCTVPSAQAALAAVQDKHDRLKKMVDDGSVNGRMYSAALEQEKRITALEAALLQAREAIALTKVWHSNKLHKYLVLPRANEAIAAIDSVGVTK